ncbi:Response regulator PleD [Thalassocella blandensis]|nr:Response regulator PleD [Thalassocella blandensis]
MVTLVSSRTEQPTAHKKDGVNGFPGENEFQDLRFKLAHKLQSTLDINTALELFYDNIQELVRVTGLRYQFEQTSLEIDVGTLAKHSVSYNISSTNTHLGQITFTREKVFLEPELAVLEMLIGILFFPLRNALLYREALESSMRDSLTGIGNRTAMENSFTREIKLSRRHRQPLSLLLIDVDHFKKINDSVGHRNGDRTLQQIVKSIQHTLRETDQIFRFGGEEFVALLHNTTREEAKLIAERIRVNVAMSPISLVDQNVFATVSVGVSSLAREDDSDSFFERADAALYEAKNSGRNCVITADHSAQGTHTKKNRKKKQNLG